MLNLHDCLQTYLGIFQTYQSLTLLPSIASMDLFVVPWRRFQPRYSVAFFIQFHASPICSSNFERDAVQPNLFWANSADPIRTGGSPSRRGANSTFICLPHVASATRTEDVPLIVEH